jgi:glycosyltransferase involved in cell wall biosynthesis
MRALLIVKTSDGAEWAALQAAELVRLGVEVHVALPSLTGRMVKEWQTSGALLHVAAVDFPAKKPWLLPAICLTVRKLVAEISPDLIHTHHVGPALVVRIALKGKNSPPRVFQVPGPLHLEHWFYRNLEIFAADSQDYWIGTSRKIVQLYSEAGISPDRLLLSYNGTQPASFETRRTNILRSQLGVAPEEKMVGNISFIYPPKFLLGQRIGLKAHEDLIDALGLVIQQRPDVVGVLVGGTWGSSQWYEKRLRARAQAVGRGRIKMPGYLPRLDIRRIWADFDCAIHVPLSENCGGVVEPLLAGVPTIAGRVGGLPEVVMDGLTGRTVPIRDPAALASAILEVLADTPAFRTLASNGRQLVETMFDIRRTAAEVYGFYRHLLDRSIARAPEFDSMEVAKALAARHETPQTHH